MADEMPKKKAWYKRWWGITILVFIGLIVLVSLIPTEDEQGDQQASAPENGEQSDTTERRTTTTAPKKTTTTEKTLGMGDTVRVGDVEWVVKGAKKQPEMKGEFETTAKANGMFVIVDLTATMRGKEEGTVDDEQLKVKDSKGRTFSATDDFNVAMIEGDKWIFLKQINPDVTINGTAVFDVPADATGLKLEISDLVLLSDKSEVVDLGL